MERYGFVGCRSRIWRSRICGGCGGFWRVCCRVWAVGFGRHLQANRHRARRHEFKRFRNINRDWIAYPAQPYCLSFLHFLFNDIAQDQKSNWPKTYEYSPPLCMSFL